MLKVLCTVYGPFMNGVFISCLHNLNGRYFSFHNLLHLLCNYDHFVSGVESIRPSCHGLCGVVHHSDESRSGRLSVQVIAQEALAAIEWVGSTAQS